MICLELSINGQKVSTAGLDGPGVITQAITWHRHADEKRTRPLSLRLGGLDTRVEPGTFLHWTRSDLAAGDVVTVRVLEDAPVDPPQREAPPQAAAKRAQVIRSELKDMETRRRQLERELKRISKAPAKRTAPKKRKAQGSNANHR